MSQEIIVRKVDDLDGTVGDVATIQFALDGIRYEIDLNTQNAEQLRTLLGPYTAAARRVTRPGPLARRSPARAIREWANRSGYFVGPTGGIPTDVRNAFLHRRPLPPAPTIAPLDLDLFLTSSRP